MPGALELPPISTSILADVEQAAVSLGVTRDQMTEAAARAAAALCRKILDNEMAGATVVGLCGNGVKGCVALHTLRILHGFGADCSAVLAGGEREMRAETAAAASVCEALRMPLLQPRSPAVRALVADADLVVDGLVGRDGALTAKGQRVAEKGEALLAALEKLGEQRKWSLPILHALGPRSRRFGELKEALPEATPRALSMALKDLAAAGLIERRIVDGFPPRTEYVLQQKARALPPLLEQIARV